MALLEHNYEPEFSSRLTPDEKKTVNDGYPVLTFGIENEITYVSPRSFDHAHGVVSGITDKIDANYGPFIYCKHDGTTCNRENNQRGFEIVTQPFSLNWLYSGKNIYNIDNVLGMLSDEGFHVDETCGMHVHISKEVITDLTIAKLKMFAKNNPYAMFLLSGRAINEKAFGFYRDYSRPGSGPSSHYDQMRRSSRNKYAAIRLDKPYSVEFRFFGATLNLETFLSNIEFAYSLPVFCKNNSLEDLSISSFINFIKDNRKTYPNVYKHIINASFNIDTRKISSDYVKLAAQKLKEAI